MEKRQVYIMGISDVDFMNRETGEIVKGTSCHYYDFNDKSENGFIPSKKFLRDGEDTVVKRHGPGVYNMLIEIELTAKGPRLNMSGFEFVKPAEMLIKGA